MREYADDAAGSQIFVLWATKASTHCLWIAGVFCHRNLSTFFRYFSLLLEVTNKIATKLMYQMVWFSLHFWHRTRVNCSGTLLDVISFFVHDIYEAIRNVLIKLSFSHHFNKLAPSHRATELSPQYYLLWLENSRCSRNRNHFVDYQSKRKLICVLFWALAFWEVVRVFSKIMNSFKEMILNLLSYFFNARVCNRHDFIYSKLHRIY